MRLALGRGVALFWGLLLALDASARLAAPTFDAALWWVDLRSWPPFLAHGLLAVFAGLLVAYALWPKPAPRRKWLTAAALCCAIGAMLGDGVRFLQLWSNRTVKSDFPLPMSFFAALSLWCVLGAVLGEPPDSLPRRARVVCMALVLAVLAVAVPVAQMFCFGCTDYARPADVAVVFGARAYANGGLSNALAHRVHTACALHKQGLVKTLLFSGGPGDGAVHETEAMRREAVRLGVPASDIVLDPGGLSTQETVRNTVPMLHAMGAKRVLAVSHFYHLPRVKMCYQAAGVDVWTVPAHQDRVLRQLPWLIVREVGGLWAYYLRAVFLAPPEVSAAE